MEIDNFVPEPTDWFCIVLYTLDSSGDATKVAQVKVFPCAKIEKLNVAAKNDDISVIDFSGHATYALTLPTDQANISDYLSSVT